MSKITIIIVLFVCFFMYVVSPISHTDTDKHVLLIGIDGCKPSALELALQEIEQVGEGELPYFQELFHSGVYDLDIYSGGRVGTETEQPTDSGPSWTTILTGVWANI